MDGRQPDGLVRMDSSSLSDIKGSMMKGDSTIPIKDSIGFNLIKLVFSIYIIIAAIVTLAHMAIEYFNVKSSMLQDLQLYQSSFEEPLADSLWDLDLERTKTITPGIVKLPSIVGLQIYDLGDSLISAEGLTHDNLAEHSGGILPTQLLEHEFSIVYTKENEEAAVGRAVFYSSSDVVLTKVQAGFALIIINAIIKTTALWAIFLYIVRPTLIRPIEHLSSALQNLTFDKLSKSDITIPRKRHDELKVLEQSINAMTTRLAESSDQLNELNKNLDRSHKLALLLLRSVTEMKESKEKQDSFSAVSNVISEAIPCLSSSALYISYYHQNTNRIPNLDASDTPIIEESYRQDGKIEILVRDAQIHSKTSHSEEKLQGNLINIPLRHGKELVGSIEILSKTPVSISIEEQQFISTLIPSLIISLEDISIRSNLETAVRERTSDLQRSNHEIAIKAQELAQISQSKSQFLSNISHEIHTPLNAIITLTEQNAQNSQIQDPVAVLSVIHHSAENLLKVIENLVDYSEIESGKAHLNPIRFNLESLVSEAIDHNKPAAQGKGLQLKLKTKVINTSLFGDSKRLLQILNIFLDNALKFTTQGSVILSVSQQASSNALSQFEFSIRDTGLGMDKDKIKTLFNITGNDSAPAFSTQTGHGLNLSISKQLIEMMDGELEIDSTPDEGSSFSFTLSFKNACESEPIEDE
ncbi:ATP-binding protein [Neptuniibacter sp. QD48_11]|uniref:ATP-binding protein n=1 Tax=Neptuniibacter sp. QD48_11 TaxID=3398211 RepID=UPI0039F523E3